MFQTEKFFIKNYHKNVDVCLKKIYCPNNFFEYFVIAENLPIKNLDYILFPSKPSLLFVEVRYFPTTL